MDEHKAMKGYKVFDPDWTCSPNGEPFQYEVGKTYEEDVEPKVCNRGFHFCKNAIDCFKFYEFNPENKVAEVLALGKVDTDGTKSCTDKIQIVREVPWAELLGLVNTGKGCTGYSNSGDRNSGNYNSGNRNSGDYNSGICNSGNYNSGNCNSGNYNSGSYNSGNRNSGNCNSGYGNSGHCNSGDYNSGDYNSGNYNSGYGNSGNRNSGDYNSGIYNSGDWNKCNFSSGCFNTKEANILMFNKPSPWTYRDWLNSEARNLLDLIPREKLEYRYLGDMTDEEKAEHPEAETTGGYLKKIDNSKNAVIWWSKLSDEQKAIITGLPNFDAAIFEEITGIDVGLDSVTMYSFSACKKEMKNVTKILNAAVDQIVSITNKYAANPDRFLKCFEQSLLKKVEAKISQNHDERKEFDERSD